MTKERKKGRQSRRTHASGGRTEAKYGRKEVQEWYQEEEDYSDQDLCTSYTRYSPRTMYSDGTFSCPNGIYRFKRLPDGGLTMVRDGKQHKDLVAVKQEALGPVRSKEVPKGVGTKTGRCATKMDIVKKLLGGRLEELYIQGLERRRKFEDAKAIGPNIKNAWKKRADDRKRWEVARCTVERRLRNREDPHVKMQAMIRVLDVTAHAGELVRKLQRDQKGTVTDKQAGKVRAVTAECESVESVLKLETRVKTKNEIETITKQKMSISLPCLLSPVPSDYSGHEVLFSFARRNPWLVPPWLSFPSQPSERVHLRSHLLVDLCPWIIPPWVVLILSVSPPWLVPPVPNGSVLSSSLNFLLLQPWFVPPWIAT